MFANWCLNRHPEIVAEYEAENAKLNRLAELERLITESVNAANALRAELGQGSGPVPVPDAPKPEKKARAPRKPKPPVETPVDESHLDNDTRPDLPAADPVADAPEADAEDDAMFEKFEIPEDNEGDEF